MEEEPLVFIHMGFIGQERQLIFCYRERSQIFRQEIKMKCSIRELSFLSEGRLIGNVALGS